MVTIPYMDIGSGDWPAWIGLGISVVALVVSGLAARYSFLQVKAAQEANRIQRAALDVARRQYDLQSKQTDGRQAYAPPYVPPWRIEHTSNDGYALTNGGSDTEHDVQIEQEDTYIEPERLGDVGPMDSIPVIIVFTSASPSHSVLVSWRHADEKQRRTQTIAVRKS